MSAVSEWLSAATGALNEQQGARRPVEKVWVRTTRDLERKTADGMERNETLITLSTTKETWSISP